MASKTYALSLRPAALAVSLLLASHAHAVGNGNIASGAGSIDKNGNTTTVNQSSDKLIVNWDNMDVAKGDTLNFAQKNAQASVLNRIASADPTTIMGALNANGRVFIVNPNGVLIGNGAAINVGSLVASSLNISDADFNADKLNFAGGGKGNVINQGTINAAESVALIGSKKVENTGAINATNSNVVLASGDAISLTFSWGNLEAKLTQGSLEALVNNGGLIATQEGDIVLTAWARDALTRSVINNTGVLEAKEPTYGTYDDVSRVRLTSLESGEVNVGGRISVAYMDEISRGISVSGAGINVLDGAQLSTSTRDPFDPGYGDVNEHINFTSKGSGYVKFGNATLNANRVNIEANNVLTSGAGPTFDKRVRVYVNAPGNVTLFGSVPDAERYQSHNGSGMIDSGFLKAVGNADSLNINVSGQSNINVEKG
jgi:filamentous hemagglutinin family protein